MSKYFNLTKSLTQRDGEEWELSLSDVENILDAELPESARQYPAWWANQGRAQSLAWESAGWRTKRVDLKNERVTFVYVGDGVDRDLGEALTLTIAEAKSGLAATFNVPVEAIEITIRG